MDTGKRFSNEQLLKLMSQLTPAQMEAWESFLRERVAHKAVHIADKPDPKRQKIPAGEWCMFSSMMRTTGLSPLGVARVEMVVTCDHCGESSTFGLGIGGTMLEAAVIGWQRDHLLRKHG